MNFNIQPSIIFDASIFIHANYHIACNYVAASEIDSELLAKKVTSQIENIAFNKFPGRPVVLALDHPGNSFRNKIYEFYKAGRTPKTFDPRIVNDYLSKQFFSLEAPGLEADDLAYLFSLKYPGTTMISEDNDYLLMMSPGTTIYKYRQKKLIEYTSEFDVIIEQLLKLCGGCTSDNVPSIKVARFAEKTLRKLIEPGDILEEYLIDLEARNKISDWKRNYELVMYDEKTYRKYLGDNFIDSVLKFI